MGLILCPGRCHMPRSNYACVPRLLSPSSSARELQLLRLCTRTTEAHAPGPVLQSKRRPWNEKPHAMKSIPCSLQLKSMQKAVKIQCSQKPVNNFFLKKEKIFYKRNVILFVAEGTFFCLSELLNHYLFLSRVEIY